MRFLFIFLLFATPALSQVAKKYPRLSQDADHSICVDDGGVERCLTVDGPTASVLAPDKVRVDPQGSTDLPEVSLEVGGDNDGDTGGILVNQGTRTTVPGLEIRRRPSLNTTHKFTVTNDSEVATIQKFGSSTDLYPINEY